MIETSAAQSNGYWIALIPVGLFALLAIAELLFPRRALVLAKLCRWRTHGIFFLCNSVLGRAIAPFIAVSSAALWAQSSGFGLLNLASWPLWLEISLAFIMMDFTVWLQHVAMHRLPVLWRMHKVHHSDRDLDVTSALRFHPLELAVSIAYKSVCAAMLGIPVIAAAAFEVWLNANALFNHSNIKLPRKLDHMLRTLLVTPDYHYVHHSIVRSEQQHNYGFALTIWDRIAGYYAAESFAGREHQITGLEGSQDSKPQTARWSLTLPFKN
jgi:sterol desaturase/sphingolipid hydroxylase (fatty acid hydroxylase superfamily)